MNVIPENGAIQITFPAEYTAPLDPICRIIRGLVDRGTGTGNVIQCTTTARNVKIIRFA